MSEVEEVTSELVQLHGIAVDLAECSHPATIIKMSRIVLAEHGVDKRAGFIRGKDAREYVDGTVRIRSNYNGLELEIERRPMPYHGMPGSNPVIMVNPGDKCIRTHGEQAYIVDHLVDMVRRINGTPAL